MKSIINYILEKLSDSVISDWIYNFTSSHRNAKNTRFLNPDKDTDKQIIKEFDNVDECKIKLYRASYPDAGNIWKTNEGDTCYEPVLSFSSDEKFVDSTNNEHKYNDVLSHSEINPMKIILNEGSKSLNVDEYSAFKGQSEYLVCGKFKVIKKELVDSEYTDMSDDKHKYKLNVVTIEQVFDEPLEDIFATLYKEYRKNFPPEKTDMPEDKIAEILKDECKRRKISKPEKDRWEKKGIELTEEFLAKTLARRIYENGFSFINSYHWSKWNQITYERVYEIATKNNIKILGAKNCGFPELDFPENIDKK